MRSQVKVSLLCPVFLPAGKNVLSICHARRICFEKFYFFFYFFVALIFEGVIVKETSQWLFWILKDFTHRTV